ncbi:MAG: glycoside hydrolase family 3 protein, partial [Bryobacteraceae bacterium]
PEHRAVARECVRQSLVLLKNDAGALPLQKSIDRIHVAGGSADNIGNQCGGWTVYWQGKSGLVTTGTSILTALRLAAPARMKVTFSLDGSGGEGSKVGIAVIGETPYAEMMGDRQELRVEPADVAIVARMKAAGMRVIVVLVSGRPLPIDDLLPHADAILAAWLPGSEGDGVADVLFGAHKPSGKLSFSWPRVFKTGYGLSYS